jgi:hypothetical protein
VSDKGDITFIDSGVKESNLGMKWHRLQAMVKPIVDVALGKLVMDGSWRDAPMKIDLGSMLVDTKTVNVDNGHTTTCQRIMTWLI